MILERSILSALAAFLVFGVGSTPAGAAEASGWYVAGAVTGSDLNKPDQTIANAPTPGATLKVVNAVDFAWGGQLSVGRRFSAFRVEAQAGRTMNDSDAYTAISPIAITLPQRGKNDVTRYMLNGFYGLPLHALPVTFDIGAGLGAADVHVTTFAAPARAPNAPPSQLIYASQTRLAYQLMAGASYPLTDHVALTAGYRWFDAGTVKGSDARGERITREIRGHNYDLGVRYSF